MVTYELHFEQGVTTNRMDNSLVKNQEQSWMLTIILFTKAHAIVPAQD